MLLPFISWLTPIFAFLLPIVSIFLILLILVQRGRGGGLVGAFGGAGGQSAFGAKAGDVFTKITIVTVCIWLLLCIFLLLGVRHGAHYRSAGFGEGKAPTPATAPVIPDAPVPPAEPQPASP